MLHDLVVVFGREEMSDLFLMDALKSPSPPPSIYGLDAKALAP